MSKKSLAFQLGVYISVAVLVVYGIFIYWAYKYNYNSTKQNIENNAIRLSYSIINNINEKIYATQLIAANISINVPFNIENGDIEQVMKNVMQENEFINAIRISILKNNFDSEKETCFLVYRDSGIVKIVNNVNAECIPLDSIGKTHNYGQNPGWTEPYRTQNGKPVVATYYLPFRNGHIYENNYISGTVSCELSLDFINKLILSTKIGKTGFAHLISSKGVFMTHPNQEYILQRTMFNLPKGVFEGDSARIDRFLHDDSGSVTVYPTIFNNVRCWVYHTKIKETNWVLSVTFPFSELYSPLNVLLTKMSVIALLVVLAVFFVVFAISQRLIYPISRITKQLHSFSLEDLTITKKSINEAEVLTESLVKLQNMYSKFKNEQIETIIAKNKYSQELQLAAEIQQSLIPTPGKYSFDEQGVTIFSEFRPARIVSGDFYNFFLIDNHRILIAIGDVSGKGIPAALFMGIGSTLLKFHSTDGDVRNIASLANKELCKNNVNQFFLTLFLGIIDTELKSLNYCNAGHTPSLLLNTSGKTKKLDNAHGLPLGLYPDRNYKSCTVNLEKGDKLVLYTDGLTEQLNESGEMFGFERLQNLLTSLHVETPDETVNMMLGEVKGFMGNREFNDDMSLVVLKLD